MKRIRVLFLEGDDKENELGLEFKAYMSSSKIKVYARVFKHKENSTVLYNRVRTLDDVRDLVIKFLKNHNVIVDINNWEYSTAEAVKFEETDLCEDKELYSYFAFVVKERLLKF